MKSKLLFWTLAVLLAAGCQSYQRSPVDLDAHREAFLARTPASDDVASLARRLETEGRGIPSGFDVSDGVSLAEAELVALVFNADLRIARLKAGIARAGAEHAGHWDDPTLGVDITKIIESVDHPWKLAGTVGFTIPISGRLKIEKQRATAEHAAELARLLDMEWSTRIALRQAWADWTALTAEADAMREFVSRLDGMLTIIDAMERVGELARTEARLFRIDHATRRGDLALVQSRLIASTLAIKRIMGLAPTAPLTLTPGNPVGSESTLDAAAVLESAQDRSPRLQVARAWYEVHERALQLEIRKQYPDLTLSPGLGNEDGMDEVLLGISLPLPVLNRNRRAIAEATAAREAARAEVEGEVEALVAELAAAAAQFNSAAQRRRTFEQEIVPMVDAQYADSRRTAELGEVNTLVLLESMGRQQEAKTRLIESRRDEARAAIRIDQLVGPPAEGAKP